MNTTSQTESNALQVANASEDPKSTSANALMMNPEAMNNVMRMAEMMAGGKSTVPAHLQKNPADCMAVVLQAMQWGMLPHVVAQKTHLVNGTLGYEAQLVNAVVQASGAIIGRFHYEYKGNSPAIECRVGAIIKGETEITWGEWLNENKVTTKNSPLWKTNPKQQMGYLQCKNWSRLYTPGAILGVYTPDEFEQAAPRNMGAAQIVRPELPESLVGAANEAAACGMADYQKFWQTTGPENRRLLAGEHDRLKSVAVDADKSRTVEAKPVKNFDEVMVMICSARTEEALFVAADWINAIVDGQDILNEKFDEVLATLRGAQ